MPYASFAPPYEMRVTAGKESSDGAALVGAAEQAVAGAALSFAGTGGDYFLYTSETVRTAADPDGTSDIQMTLTRPIREENGFVLQVADHATVSEAPIDVSDNGQQLVGEGLQQFRSLAQAIGSGALAGSHTVIATKFLEHPGHPTDRPLLLELAVTHTSVGRQESPVTTVDLRYSRTHDPASAAKLHQVGRVVSDPHRGEVQFGYSCESEQLVPTGALDAAEQPVRVAMTDPMVDGEQGTAALLQFIHAPLLALDMEVTPELWQMLVDHPLSPHHRLLR